MVKKSGGAASAGAGDGEGQDESQDATDSQDNDLKLEQGGESDVDDGAEGDEGGEVGGDDGEEGDELADENKEQEPSWVNKILERLEKAEDKKGGEEDEASEVENVLLPNFNEGQLSKLKEVYGVEEKQVKLMQNMVNMGLKAIFDHFGGKLGGLSKDRAIDAMSQDPRFKDIRKHVKAMEPLLSKFSAREQANPEVLEMVYWAAKGKSTSAQVRKTADGMESNRRVAERRPATPSGGSRGGGVKPLTADQESARKAAGMSVEEYRKYMAKSSRRQR